MNANTHKSSAVDAYTIDIVARGVDLNTLCPDVYVKDSETGPF